MYYYKLSVIITLFWQTTRAEVKIANALVQNNIPVSFTDQLSPLSLLLRDVFPDSEIAQGYAAASTKTTCVINESLAPYFKESLVDFMNSHPFSIAIDGSNDTGVEKMNPITVRYFDSNEGRVQTRFFDMCLTKGK